MRRTILLFTVTVLGILLSCGVALAVTEIGDDVDKKIEGTSGADYLNGTDEKDAIRGLAGDDAIYGGVEDGVVDEVYGGEGNDTVNLIDSPASEDRIVSCGPGRDTVYVDSRDVVASDCEIKRDAYADVSFDEPVPVAQALEVAKQTDSEIVELEDDFVVGGESMGDGFVNPPDANAETVEQAYKQERLAFFKDMANEHKGADLSPRERKKEKPQVEAMRKRVADGNAGGIQVTEMKLNGEEQEFQALASDASSGASDDAAASGVNEVESVKIEQMSAEDARLDQEEEEAKQELEEARPPDGEATGTEKISEEESSEEAIFTAAARRTWWPNYGRSKVARSAIAGRRYVSQRFTWKNKSAGWRYGYEHDFKTQNYNGYHYLTGAQTYNCFPRDYINGGRVYWSTSYPRFSARYLETNLTSRNTCQRNILTYTVGVANLGPVRSGKQYFTFIRTPKGNARRDNASLSGELV